MSQMHTTIPAADARVHANLEDALRQPVTVDRTFELPARLHVLTVGAYLGFIAIMGLGFANPEMLIPVAIFAIFTLGLFGVPAMWAQMQPDNPGRTLRWSEFAVNGISAFTGRVKARDAMVQVLILPVLILAWGVIVVSIAAVVR